MAIREFELLGLLGFLSGSLSRRGPAVVCYFVPALAGRSCAMRDGKKGVLVLGLTVAALCAPVNSSFGQAHTRMSGPPQPPKTTTTPTGTWLPKSIAYIKASNTGKDNQFGSAIALSADGNTLAVSATFEDSAAKGVNGVSKDRAVNSGAVYVYTRDSKGWKQQAYLKASNTEEG